MIFAALIKSQPEVGDFGCGDCATETEYGCGNHDNYGTADKVDDCTHER